MASKPKSIRAKLTIYDYELMTPEELLMLWNWLDGARRDLMKQSSVRDVYTATLYRHKNV